MNSSGGDYNDQGICEGCLLPEYTDPILIKYEDHIENFAYNTLPLDVL